MGLKILAIEFDELTSDPGSPVEGQIWYNVTEKKLKLYRNGSTDTLVDNVTFTVHSTSTANPHTTTLEQARTASPTLAGDVDMGGNDITNVGGSGAGFNAASESWTTEQINSKLKGLDWQNSVLDKDLAKPPAVPVGGDRYIVGVHSYAIVAVNPATEVVSIAGDKTAELSATEEFDIVGSTGNDGTYTVASIVYNAPNTEITVNEDLTDATADGSVEFSEDAWNGKKDDIAEWDGASAWIFTTPNEGFALKVEDENIYYFFNGSVWGSFGNAVQHSALIGLGNDDHTQYLLVSGARAMAGDLDMGGNNVTNVNLVDGVDVSAHAARHIKDGGDEVDGDRLDIDFTPTNYTPDTSPPEVTDVDHLTAHLKGIDDALDQQALDQKAGRVPVGSFAGNPKRATVTFATAFGDANYAVVLTPVTQNNQQFSPVVESQVAGGFTINVGANNVANLLQMNWIAMKDGESA